MKKYLLVTGLFTATIFLTYCSASKKAKAIPKLTYNSELKTVIETNCSPCHIPAKGGNKKPYDNYANVKADIDEMLRRIQLEPSARGFMPFRKSAKLSDSTVMVFKKWKEDGLLEN